MRVGVIVTQHVLARSVYNGDVIVLDAGWCIGFLDGPRPWFETTCLRKAAAGEVRYPIRELGISL